MKKMYGLEEHPGRIVIEMWEMTATTAPNVLIDDMQPALGLPRDMYHPMECCMVIAMEDEVWTSEGSQQGPSSSYWTMHVFDDSGNITCAVKGSSMDVRTLLRCMRGRYMPDGGYVLHSS